MKFLCLISFLCKTPFLTNVANIVRFPRVPYFMIYSVLFREFFIQHYKTRFLPMSHCWGLMQLYVKKSFLVKCNGQSFSSRFPLPQLTKAFKKVLRLVYTSCRWLPERSSTTRQLRSQVLKAATHVVSAKGNLS